MTDEQIKAWKHERDMARILSSQRLGALAWDMRRYDDIALLAMRESRGNHA
jgi:hypothetical protein